MIRYYEMNGDVIVPQPDSATSGTYYIDCGSDEQMFLNSACPCNVVFDVDEIRFKNDSEKKADLLPFVHEALDIKTNELAYGTEFVYNHDSTDYTFNTAGKDNYFQDYWTLAAGDYPHQIKAKGDNYCTFAIQGDHFDFIQAGAAVVRDIIDLGRCLKYGGTHGSTTYTGIYNMTYTQLKDFVDPRD